DVLLGFFFVTIGMKLDLHIVLDAWQQVLVLLVLLVLLKFALVAALVRGFGASVAVAVRSGVWLAQIGEFGFVLLAQAMLAGLVEPRALQPLLAAMLLSLLGSPLLIAQANRLALRASAREWLQRSLQLQTIASRSISRNRHVLLCGYGRSGQSVARVLQAEQVEYMALDLDPDRVQAAAAAGDPVVYGDALRRETLIAAGLHRAISLVITFDDTPAALHLLHEVRKLAPDLPVLVRSASDVDIDRLRAAGATEVVPEIVEGSLMIASHALVLAGVPVSRVLRRVREVREGRYRLLRGFFHGVEDRERETIEQAETRLQAVAIPVEAGSIGRALGELELDGVSVPAIVRRAQRIADPQTSLRIEA
ncbi:MAG: NAD-binding protein, partial [Gammaproteobacteria bacterium]